MSIERIKDLISKIEKEEYIINENYYDLNLDNSEKNDLSYNHKVYKNVKNYVGNFADKQQRFQQLIDPMLTGPVSVEEVYCMVGDIKEFANDLYELLNKQGIILKDIEIKNSSYITKNIKNGCYIASTDENYDTLQTNNREFIFKFEKDKNFSILVGVEMNLTVNKNITHEDISEILTNGGLGNNIKIISNNKTPNPNSSNNSNDEIPDSNSLINSNNKKINIEFEFRLENNGKK